MIRNSIQATEDATWFIKITLPGSSEPIPAGTGFIVSPDAIFVTAAHVIADVEYTDDHCQVLLKKRC